jgi:hypothetical protein
MMMVRTIPNPKIFVRQVGEMVNEIKDFSIKFEKI